MSSVAAPSATESRKLGDGASATRRLAAILLMDVVGYSRLVSEDENATLNALKGHLKELIRPEIAGHDGRVVKTTGDGVLAEFSSAVQAVACALEIQRQMIERNTATPARRRLEFRIGVNLAEVVFEDGDVFGDGVNVAARLEGMANPNGVCVSDDVYRHVRGKVRSEFEDLGAQTLKGITDQIRVFRTKAAGEAPTAEGRPVKEPSRSRSLSQIPWVAVLPFDNLSGDPEQGYFSDGITNDLITDLSKFSELAVIASHSVFTYKGKSARIEDVARELGVRYVVEGSVQRSGDTVRINVQLIEAASGVHLWSDRYKRPLVDLFTLCDEIIDRLVATLVARVEMSERERALRKPIESLEAYDHCLRGRELWWLWEEEANRVAQDHFRKAIELDPTFSLAYRSLSYVLIQSGCGGWAASPHQVLDEARELAERAVALIPADFENYAQLGFACLYSRDFDRSLGCYRRAVDLNPNSPDLLADMADALVHVGKTAEGVAMIQQAKQLNPLSSDWYDWVLGIAAFFDGRYEEALDALNRVGNSSSFLRCDLAATYVRLGRMDEARATVRDILQAQPNYRIGSVLLTPFKNPKVTQGFVADLKLAGIPE
jgi:TolB-like protein/class 3 adenylate cyclase/tetratricopeptide (TPR) repeat protein